MIFKFERYSPTDLKINLKKLEVVFQAEDVKIIFQSFIVLKQLLTIIGIVKLTSKQKSKLNGLYLSEPNFTELGTAQPPLVFPYYSSYTDTNNVLTTEHSIHHGL